MKTCDTCRFWSAPYSDFVMQGQPFNEAYREALDTGGICESKYVVEENSGEAYMIQPRGLAALGATVIWTGPKFGCLHWAERNDP